MSRLHLWPVLLCALLPLSACKSDVSVGKLESTMSVTPLFADFGRVAVGDIATVDVTVTGQGDAFDILNVQVLNIEGGYIALDTDPLPTVPSDGTGLLTFSYSPTEPGYHYARATISSAADRGNTREVEMTGEAAQPSATLEPGLLDFGRVPAGEVGLGNVTVVNTGTMDLVLDSVHVDHAAFYGDSSLPLDIPAGASETVTLAFSPADDDAINGTATLDFGRWVSFDPIVMRGNDCSVGGSTFDQDADGVSWCADDCDDSRPDVRPGGTEVCDGADNDCNGVVDDGTSCFDDDGDGYTEEEGDCADGDSTVNPGVEEDYGNGIDDDCDGTTDYGDTDTDGDGYAPSAGDCNDANADIHPGATETADGLDNDCDGVTDEGTDAYDDDGDGYTEVAGDCNDTDSAVSPGATETANWLDDDCDGDVDEGTAYADDDGDGFSEAGGDCDDTDASVSPAVLETSGNGIDDDCDGTID